jgi:hypothetical protein
MFKWAAKKAMAASILKDTNQTILAVNEQPITIQKEIASTVQSKISHLIFIFDNAPHMADEMLRQAYSKATDERKSEVINAKSSGFGTPFGYPPWAKATLLESWCYFMFEAFGKKQNIKLGKMISDWLGTVLSFQEIDAINREVENTWKKSQGNK